MPCPPAATPSPPTDASTPLSGHWPQPGANPSGHPSDVQGAAHGLALSGVLSTATTTQPRPVDPGNPVPTTHTYSVIFQAELEAPVALLVVLG